MRKLSILLLCLGCLHLPAQDGTHDLSFNGIGYTQYTGLSNGSQFYGVALQPDGKILAGGTYQGPGKEFPIVFRYNEDGTIDNSWNGTGYVIDTIGDRGLNVFSLGVQSNGRVLAAGPGQDCGAGTCMYVFAIAAYDQFGQPDSTWGGESQVRIYTGGNASGCMDIHVMPDDRVVLAGYFFAGSNWLLQFARLLPNGSLDSTFGTDGVAFLDLGANAEQVNNIVVESDGSIVAAGYSKAEGDEDAFIARLLPDGTPDPAFGGGDGFTRIRVPTSDERFEGLCRMQNGKYFAVGYSQSGASCAGRIYARFLANGTPDLSYTLTGYDIAHLHSLPYSCTSAQFAIALPESKVLVGGYYLGDVMYDGYVERLDSTGTRDLTFGEAGCDTLDMGGRYNLFLEAVQQPDGKIICAGGSQIPATFNTFYTLARYNQDDIIAGTSVVSPAANHTDIILFPNPAMDHVGIQSMVAFESVRITDLQGRLIMEDIQHGFSATLKLDQIPNGNYFVHAKLGNGIWASSPLLIRR